MRQTRRLKNQSNYNELSTRAYTENGTRLNIYKKEEVVNYKVKLYVK